MLRVAPTVLLARAVASVLASSAPSAFAADGNERDFRIAVSTGLTLGLSDVEERESDTVVMASSLYRWNLSVVPSWQLGRAWALGGRASWSSDAGARGQASSSGEQVASTRHLWQFGAEAQLQPRGSFGPYAAAGVGVAAAMDSIGDQSAVQWAPALGAAVGHDFKLGEQFALGLELRGGVAFFDSDGASLTSDSQVTRFVYGTSAWLGVNLVAALCL